MKILKRKTLAALLALSLLASLLPIGAQPALAGTAPQTLYVGNYQITNGSAITYLKAGSTQGSLVEGSETDWTVKYEPSTATLTLNGATIQGGTSTGSVPYGAGIYAQCSQDQPVALTIELIGENTITGYYGIYVNAEISENSNGTDASLTITGENNGSLEVSGSFYGIFVKSGTGNASLTINDASVVAKTTQTNSGYAGVCVQSGSSATNSPQLSLAVNGGSLTTSGSEGNDGIQFIVGAYVATSATTSLTVTDNAIVDARTGGISASRSSVPLPTPTPTGNNSSGIVFNGKNGTVYGSVTLQEDLTIGEGERLTIGDRASLNTGDYNVIVDGGTVEGKLETSVISRDAFIFPESLTLEYAAGQNAMYSESGEITLNKNIALNGDGKLVIYGSYEEGNPGFMLTREDGSEQAAVKTYIDINMVEPNQTQALAVFDKDTTDETRALKVLYEEAGLNKLLPPGTYKGKIVLNAGYTAEEVTAGAEVMNVELDKLWKYEIPVTLTLKSLIDTQPGDQSVIEGTSAAFSVSASSKVKNNAELTYQWQESVDGGKNWTNITEATSATYTITDTTTAISGNQYRCVVTSDMDGVVETSEAATLTVAAASYSISVDPATLNFGSITEGEERPAAQMVTITNTGNQPVTLTQPTAANYVIGKLSATTLEPNATATFTIQPKDNLSRGSYSEQIAISNTNDEKVIITATFTVKEPPYTGKYSYELTTSVGDHGSLTVDRYATEGEKVTITVSPDEAYKLDDLSVTAGGKEVALTAGGDGTYSFAMPSADVKISATFAEDPDWTEPEEPATDVSDIFLDIAANAWYKDAVQYAYAGGLMTGVSANEFAPEATTTRAMIVSMLARLEGVESAESAGFTDVAADDWYATAVNWAAASGITSGTGDGNFSPNTAITREQLAAILMNYAQYKGQDVSARAMLDTYSDATAISSWANDVMSWAVAEGLISGVTADTLQPQGAATRAQVAAILQRFLSE